MRKGVKLIIDGYDKGLILYIARFVYAPNANSRKSEQQLKDFFL